MSSSRASGASSKPKPHNVNSVYAGKNFTAGKASGPSKHGGLQALGKPSTLVRRMPPPATLPSLKAEHGQPDVVLVPQGGTGWTKPNEPATDQKPNGVNESSTLTTGASASDLRPTWAKPMSGAQASAPTTPEVTTHPASGAHAHSQTATNNRDFPSLAASVAASKGAATAEPNAWNIGANSYPCEEPLADVAPIIPIIQPSSTGYIGAATLMKSSSDRKLPERYYSGSAAAQPRAAPAKFDIRQRIARLSTESKETPEKVEESAIQADQKESTPTPLSSETSTPAPPASAPIIAHPPDFSQPPPMLPPQFQQQFRHQQIQQTTSPAPQDYPQQTIQPPQMAQSQDVRRTQQAHLYRPQEQQYRQQPPAQQQQPPDDWNRLSYGTTTTEVDYEQYLKSGRGDTGYSGNRQPPAHELNDARLNYYRNGESPSNAFSSSGSSGTGHFNRGDGGVDNNRQYNPNNYMVEETGWGDEIPDKRQMQNQRGGGGGGGGGGAPQRQFQPPLQQQQRYRADSRGTSESESGWYGGGTISANQQYPSSQRSNYPPSSGTGWYRNDGSRLPYPPPLMSLEMDMDRLNIDTNGFYNGGGGGGNNAANANYGGDNGNRSRNASTSLSTDERYGMQTQKRQSSTPQNAQQHWGTGEYHDEAANQELNRINSGDDLNQQIYYSERRNDRGGYNGRPYKQETQPISQAQPEVPYRMLKRNDEKSAEFLAHHGGLNFMPRDDEEERESRRSRNDYEKNDQDYNNYDNQQQNYRKETQKKGSQQQRSGKNDRGQKESKQSTNAQKQPQPAAPAPKQRSPSPSPKIMPAPPPVDNIWEKRKEERQKSVESDKTTTRNEKKFQQTLEHHFPPVTEAAKLQASQERDGQSLFKSDASPLPDPYQQWGQPEGKTKESNERTGWDDPLPYEREYKPPTRKHKDRGNREYKEYDPNAQPKQIDFGAEEEDNEYQGNVRGQIWTSSRGQRGHRSRGTTHHVRGGRGMTRSSHVSSRYGTSRRGAATVTASYRAKHSSYSEPRHPPSSRRSDEPRDNFSNMGEFNLEDYKFTAEALEAKKSSRRKDENLTFESVLKEEENKKSQESGNGDEDSKKHSSKKHPGSKYSSYDSDRKYRGSSSQRGAAYSRNWDRSNKRSTQSSTYSKPKIQEPEEGENKKVDEPIENRQYDENENKHDYKSYSTRPRRGSTRGTQSYHGSGRFLSRQYNKPHRYKPPGGKAADYNPEKSGNRLSAERAAGGLKSPVTSEGGADEWETASESSDFNERSGRNVDHQKSNEKEQRKSSNQKTFNRPAFASKSNNGSSQSSTTSTSNENSQETNQKSFAAKNSAVQKNAQPASLTSLEQNVSGKNKNANANNSRRPNPNNNSNNHNLASSGNSTSKDHSNRNARDSRSIHNGASTTTIKSGLAGVDIRDASVIIIDDHPDLGRDEAFSDAGDFEEVLSKKSKKQRLQQIEEEKRRQEEYEKERERISARKARTQPKRIDKMNKRFEKRHQRDPNTNERKYSDSPKTLRDATQKSLQRGELSVSTEMIGTVWNSAHVPTSIDVETDPQRTIIPYTDPNLKEFCDMYKLEYEKNNKNLTTKPRLLPSPIARPKPQSTDVLNVIEATTEISTFTTANNQEKYDFAFDQAVTKENATNKIKDLEVETTQSKSTTLSLRNSSISSQSEIHDKTAGFGDNKGKTGALKETDISNADHAQLKEKLDKVKDFWPGQQEFTEATGLLAVSVSNETNHVSQTASTDKPSHSSLSQAHGPNVAKVKPQPQNSEQQQPQATSTSSAATHSYVKPSISDDMTNVFMPQHPTSYMTTPQSPITSNMFSQVSTMFMGNLPGSGLSSQVFNGFSAPYSVMYGGPELLTQTFISPHSANSPPATQTMFGQGTGFFSNQRSRPSSYVEHTVFLQHGAPLSNSNAATWSATNNQLEFLTNLPHQVPSMHPIGVNGGSNGPIIGPSSGGSSQYRFSTSRPPSRPPTAISNPGGSSTPATTIAIASTHHSSNSPYSPSAQGGAPMAKPLTIVPTHIPPPNTMPPTHIPPPPMQHFMPPPPAFDFSVPPPTGAPVQTNRFAQGIPPIGHRAMTTKPAMGQNFPIQNVVRQTPIQFSAPPPPNRNAQTVNRRAVQAQPVIQPTSEPKDQEIADTSANQQQQQTGWSSSSSVQKLSSQSPKQQPNSDADMTTTSTYGLFSMQFGAPTSAT